jgi:hypothetical protein
MLEIMLKVNSLLTQNVIGRITHGLIGLDLYIEERKENTYLKDFQTLTEEQVKAALLSTSVKMGLMPRGEVTLSEEQKSFIDSVKKAQAAVNEIDHKDAKELEPIIEDLGSRMNIIYRNLTHSRL